MRDEDLKNLPQSIEGWRIAELLSGIGITRYNNVREILIEPRRIQVTVYATDENGRRYVEYRPEDVEVSDLGEKAPGLLPGRSVPMAAEHVISLPFVGSWEKPVDVVANGQVECAAISLWKEACLAWDADHPEEAGEHDWVPNWKDLLTDGEREEYRGRAREMLKWMGLG